MTLAINWHERTIVNLDTGVATATLNGLDHERLNHLYFKFHTEGWWLGVYLMDAAWTEDTAQIDGVSSCEVRITVKGDNGQAFYILSASPEYWDANIENLKPTMTVPEEGWRSEDSMHGLSQEDLPSEGEYIWPPPPS